MSHGYGAIETRNAFISVLARACSPRDLAVHRVLIGQIKMSLSLKKVAQKPDMEAPSLTDAETLEAEHLLNRGRYPAVERSFVDPAQPQQAVALVSFLPCEGATPNRLGLFGFAKVRGVYSTEKEAHDRAVHLIRNIDSVHTIHHVRVGHAFPVGDSDFQERWSERVVEERDAAMAARMDPAPADAALRDLAAHADDGVEPGLARKLLLEDVTESFEESLDVREARETERDRKARESVLKRERLLIEDARDGPCDVDRYITERNKYATVATRYAEREREMQKYREILNKTWRSIRRLETPEILASYRDVYQRTLAECGVDVSDPAGQRVRDNFENLPVFDFVKE